MTVRERFARFLFRRCNLHWSTPSGLEVEVGSYSDWIIYNDVFVAGEYDRAILECLDDGPSPLILDIGANVGFFSLRVFDLMRRPRRQTVNGRVLAFEASVNTAKELSARLEKNKLDHSVRVIVGLVGKRTGEVPFMESSFSAMSRAEPGTSLPSLGYVDVEATVGSSSVALLKCDIEGSEQDFLENYAELISRTQRAIFEFHSDRCDTARCRELLRKSGLECVEEQVKGLLALAYYARR